MDTKKEDMEDNPEVQITINKQASERKLLWELKMNMLNTNFKDKKQVVKMLNESKAELTNWFFDEMQNIKCRKILTNGLQKYRSKFL